MKTNIAKRRSWRRLEHKLKPIKMIGERLHAIDDRLDILETDFADLRNRTKDMTNKMISRNIEGSKFLDRSQRRLLALQIMDEYAPALKELAKDD